MNSLKDFHDHYLLRDVLLLSDVFHIFRKSVIERHKLDCLHSIAMPSLAWAMALRHTGANIHVNLLTDPGAYLMIEKFSSRGNSDDLAQICFCE